MRYTPAALEHLGEVGDYIAQDNPNMGRRGHLEGTRELVIPRLPYYVAYRITETAVEVFAVIHTARMWPEKPE